MSAAGEIFEVLTLTYTDFKGKNGHRRRDTILTPRSNLKFRFAYAPKAPTPQDCVSSFRLKNHHISSLVRKKLPKSPLVRKLSKGPPHPRGGWVYRKGGPLRAFSCGLSPYG